MADSDLLKAQKEAAKKAQEDTNRQLAAINKLIDANKGEAKDRVKLLKMQADLKQTQQTLSGDLGKNITDMKEGFTTSINGMINETFGPLGGMVTSLTTGFFKRGKENRENITQNEMQNDNAKEMIKKLGGIQEAVESTDGKTAALDKDKDSKKEANGGEVDAGKEESEGFGIMLLRFLGTVSAAAAGLAAGAAAGVVTYFTDIFKLLGKGVMKLISSIPTPKFLDEIIDTLKNFGGGVLTKIKNFFVGETSVFKRIGKIIDPVIDAVKGFGGGIFDSIKGVFKSLGGVGDMIMAPIKAIMDFFPGGKGEGGIIGKILGFLSPFKSVFSAFARLGAKLVAPLNIILGIFDAGFETKDAVEKSDGFFASLLNGIIGALGGFIDGAVLSLLDLVKDGVSWVAGKFGFEEIEKSLDSFSFSEIFNKILDSIYGFVNKIFNAPGELVSAGVGKLKSMLPGFLGGGDARGAFIVNQPTYLPSSGRIIGEHGTYTGGGLAYGGIPDGGPEAVIPLSSTRAGAFIDPMAQSVAGMVMNRLQMERMSGVGGGGGSTVVTDARSTQTNNNTTVINNPSPIGQMLPDEGRDFVSKVA